MNGSRSNSSSVAPLRADTLFLILIGIFIAIGGGLTAMLGGKIPALSSRRLAKNHADPQWRGVFEGGVVCLMCLAIQGLTDDRFVPTYPQVALYGLALGQAQSTCSTKRTQP
jgi:hypothetical protein